MIKTGFSPSQLMKTKKIMKFYISNRKEQVVRLHI